MNSADFLSDGEELSVLRDTFLAEQRAINAREGIEIAFRRNASTLIGRARRAVETLIENGQTTIRLTDTIPVDSITEYLGENFSTGLAKARQIADHPYTYSVT